MRNSDLINLVKDESTSFHYSMPIRLTQVGIGCRDQGASSGFFVSIAVRALHEDKRDTNSSTVSPSV